jgi:Fic family protein
MMTLRQLLAGLETVPAATAWYLADLGRGLGKQELFTRQSPQRLKVLREHAMIESAVSSNRIEGVEVDPQRVRTIIFGKRALRDRNEEEIRGYREALRLIHEQGGGLAVSEETVCRLHRLSRGEIWDAGRYKERDGEIIEKYADGRERVRFRPVPAAQTSGAMAELVSLWARTHRERPVDPVIALAAFNLDFLCIHPFRDGNGRVSRLLLLLQCYHLGYEVGRYISLERLIEQNKERYYETLEQSSARWHEGVHDPWPYVNYLLFILKTAYREFEERVGQTVSPKGEKAALVRDAISGQAGEFRLVDIERVCPGVTREWIRTLLANMKAVGEVSCQGKGLAARWRFLGTKGSTLK